MINYKCIWDKENSFANTIFSIATRRLEFPIVLLIGGNNHNNCKELGSRKVSARKAYQKSRNHVQAIVHMDECMYLK